MPKRIQESESEGSDGSSDESLDLNDSDGDSDSGGGSIDSEPPVNKKARVETTKAPAKAPTAQKEIKSPVTKLTSPPKSSAKSAASGQPSKPSSSVPATSALPTSSAPTSSTAQASSGDITRGPPITTDVAAKKLIGQYLTQQNRPYSAIQVHDNLHKRVPKATVERVLTSMSLPDSGFICKEYGKAKIYFVDQNTLPSNFTPHQLDQITAENDALKTENDVRSAEERRMRGELQQLLNEPRDAELEEMIRAAREKVEEKRARVARLASGTFIAFLSLLQHTLHVHPAESSHVCLHFCTYSHHVRPSTYHRQP